MDDTTEIDSNAIIDNTGDYTEEDDEPEEEIYKMTAIDFVVDYLLQDMAFAEYFFNRNRWDEVEQKYEIERKKLLQPTPQIVATSMPTQESEEVTARNIYLPSVMR